MQEDAIFTMLYMLVEYILFTKFIHELVATKAIKGVHVNIIVPSFKKLSYVIVIWYPTYYVCSSDVDSLSQLERLINNSAKSNMAVRMTTPDGSHTFEWHDWKNYFHGKFRSIPGIR